MWSVKPAWKPRSRMIQDTVLVGGPGGGADGLQQLGLPGPKGGQGERKEKQCLFISYFRGGGGRCPTVHLGGYTL
jgi:hypothetical protein